MDRLSNLWAPIFIVLGWVVALCLSPLLLVAWVKRLHGWGPARRR